MRILVDRTPDHHVEAAVRRSARRHARACPRQVLGVRMGVHALERFGLHAGARELLTIVETDGCFVDGIEAATACSLGARTLAVEDVGKVAATFVDLRTSAALRMVPHPDARSLAGRFAPMGVSRYESQLLGYRQMLPALLLRVTPVQLRASSDEVRGHRGHVVCEGCNEEVIDGREVATGAQTLCRPCATGNVYYASATG